MSKLSSVVVTGTSAGIGKAVAALLLKEGMTVIGGSRRPSELNHPQYHHIELDVSNKESIADFVAQAVSFDPQVLVNNAGLAIGTDFVEQGQYADWETMIRTNVLGVLELSARFLPILKKHALSHLIQMSSIAAHEAYAGGAVYAGTKHMLRAATKSMRLENLGTGVRISMISPGMVETEFSKVRFHQDTERAAQVYKGMEPLLAEDIAQAVLFTLRQPDHVNIDEMIIMPRDQASCFHVHRKSSDSQ